MRGSISVSSYVQLHFVYVVRDQPPTTYMVYSISFDLKITASSFKLWRLFKINTYFYHLFLIISFSSTIALSPPSFLPLLPHFKLHLLNKSVPLTHKNMHKYVGLWSLDSWQQARLKTASIFYKLTLWKLMFGSSVLKIALFPWKTVW